MFGRLAEQAPDWKPGSVLSVTGRLGGRDWNGKVYGDNVAISVEVVSGAAEKSAGASSDDDVPPPSDDNIAILGRHLASHGVSAIGDNCPAATMTNYLSNDSVNASAIDSANANSRLDRFSAKERILWAVETFGDNVVLLSSMQRTSMVQMHLFHTLGLPNEILFIDTGYHFAETLRMRDELMRQFRLNIVTLYPELTVEEQRRCWLFTSVEGQPQCCRLRKEAPLLKYLATKQSPVLVGGLRRSEGGNRALIKILSPICAPAGTSCRPSVTGPTTPSRTISPNTTWPSIRCTPGATPSIGCSPCTTPDRARRGSSRWSMAPSAPTRDQ